MRIPVFFQNSLKILAKFMVFNPEILYHESPYNKDIPLHNYVTGSVPHEASCEMKFNLQSLLRSAPGTTTCAREGEGVHFQRGPQPISQGVLKLDGPSDLS